jgi:hypothetical protein
MPRAPNMAQRLGDKLETLTPNPYGVALVRFFEYCVNEEMTGGKGSRV